MGVNEISRFVRFGQSGMNALRSASVRTLWRSFKVRRVGNIRSLSASSASCSEMYALIIVEMDPAIYRMRSVSSWDGKISGLTSLGIPAIFRTSRFEHPNNTDIRDWGVATV